MRTDESPEAAVRKHCPPQAAGEDARQNCESQTLVICVAADASGMTASASSRTARSSILASRCRARLGQCRYAVLLLLLQDGPVFKHQDCQAATPMGEVRAVEISSRYLANLGKRDRNLAICILALEIYSAPVTARRQTSP